MAENDLKVIVKAKELAVHSFKLTSNCNRYPKKYRHSLVDRIQGGSIDIYSFLSEAYQINHAKHKKGLCRSIINAISSCEDMLICVDEWKAICITEESLILLDHIEKNVCDVEKMSIEWLREEKYAR